MDRDSICRVLAYEPDTGIFRWKEARGPKRVDDVAGSMLGEYFSVRVFGKTLLAHRLAVLIMTGTMPDTAMTVDHRDGDKLNNRWENLRVVTQGVNNQNLRRARVGSKSGLIGAHWNKRENKWQAAIRINGKVTHLGRFNTAEEAHAAYISKKREVHDGCTI